MSPTLIIVKICKLLAIFSFFFFFLETNYNTCLGSLTGLSAGIIVLLDAVVFSPKIFYVP